MAPRFCSRALAAGTLATLALGAPARAGEFGPSHACSRADAHSGRAIASMEAPEDAALAVEALRTLPTAPAPSRTSPEAFGAPVAARSGEHAHAPYGVASDVAAREDGAPRPPDEDAPPDPAAALERSATLEAGGPPEAEPLAFRDSGAPRERFRSWRELRVLRLWDNARMTVWFGLDRRGRPGVHFRQRNPGEQVPAAHAAPYAPPPPLRSVPLTSP